MNRVEIRHAVVLVVVLAAAALSAWLLIRTVDAAEAIDDRAQAIAESGRGINLATDSVMQLQRTNEIAGSILESARPLDEQLAQIVDLSRRIDGTAVAIDATAGEIGTTVADINDTVRAIDATAARIDSVATEIESSAAGIEREAGQIVSVARRIDRDVRLINTNLDDSIRIGRNIFTGTGNILIETLAGHQNAACIDLKVPDPNAEGDDGDCQRLAGAEEEAEEREPDGRR